MAQAGAAVAAPDVQPVPYTIRAYEPGDEERTLALVRSSLGGGRSFERTTAFWRWKHFDNPFGASQLMLGVGEEVLGLRAFMRWAFLTPAGRVRAVRAVDTATHPGYRRLGIFSKLTTSSVERARADGVHLIFNTPNPQSMPGYLKLGWTRVGSPYLLVRILNPFAIPRALLARRRRPVDRPAEADLAGLLRTDPHPAGDLFADPEREAALARLITADDALCAGGIRTARSVEFLRWRYADPPSTRYYAHWAGPSPETALVIFRPSVRGGLREIMLTEVLLAGPDRTPIRAVIDQLMRMVSADYLAASAAPGTAHWRALRGAGFLPLRGMGPNFTALALNWPPEAPDPTRLASWRLALSDLEIF